MKRASRMPAMLHGWLARHLTPEDGTRRSVSIVRTRATRPPRISVRPDRAADLRGPLGAAGLSRGAGRRHQDRDHRGDHAAPPRQPIDQNGKARPERAGSPKTNFRFRGGCTLIIDPDKPMRPIRYAISKRVMSERPARAPAQFLSESQGLSLRALYFGGNSARAQGAVRACCTSGTRRSQHGQEARAKPPAARRRGQRRRRTSKAAGGGPARAARCACACIATGSATASLITLPKTDGAPFYMHDRLRHHRSGRRNAEHHGRGGREHHRATPTASSTSWSSRTSTTTMCPASPWPAICSCEKRTPGKLAVGEVWFAWTEDPADALASRLRG